MNYGHHAALADAHRADLFAAAARRNTAVPRSQRPARTVTAREHVGRVLVEAGLHLMATARPVAARPVSSAPAR